MGIFTFGDLLFHFPFRYVDRTRFYSIRDSNLPYIQVRGRIVSLRSSSKAISAKFMAMADDGTGGISSVGFRD